jgi:hypothetical protein
MESRLREDLSGVRVHDGPLAGESALALGARAYTVANQIVFAPGSYAPETSGGRKLLAHELTHVLQQRGTSPDPSRARIVDARHSSEKEAGRVAEEMVARPAGDRVAVSKVSEASTLLIQRQEIGGGAEATGVKRDWYMLKVPPVVKQQSLTCWAAALSSWLAVLGVQEISFQNIILRYIGKSCIDDDNALPYATAEQVYAEWGADFTLYTKADLTGPKIRQLLRSHGHLLFAQTGHTTGHVLVVYGLGFDDKRMPNPNYVSVMDPISGTHTNLAIEDLDFPIEVGHLSKRIRPAPCLEKALDVPAEEAE